jgi:hypothetical protein
MTNNRPRTGKKDLSIIRLRVVAKDTNVWGQLKRKDDSKE